MLKNRSNLRKVKQDLETKLKNLDSNDTDAIESEQKNLAKVEGAIEVLEGLEKKYALVDRDDWSRLLKWVNEAVVALEEMARVGTPSV